MVEINNKSTKYNINIPNKVIYMEKNVHGAISSILDDIEKTILNVGVALHINPDTHKLEGAYILKDGDFEGAIDALYLFLHTIQSEAKESEVKKRTIAILDQFIEFLGSKDTAEFVVTH